MTDKEDTFDDGPYGPYGEDQGLHSDDGAKAERDHLTPLPCPFCGGEALITVGKDKDYPIHAAIVCTYCDGSIGFNVYLSDDEQTDATLDITAGRRSYNDIEKYLHDKAIRKWNTRA